VRPAKAPQGARTLRDSPGNERDANEKSVARDARRAPPCYGVNVRVRRLFDQGTPVFSFEFFPPKTEAGMATLEKTLGELAELAPAYVSVTYGAGGSTRDRTVQLVSRMQRTHGLTAVAHLTCVGASRDELAAVLEQLREAGVENVLALRGDPPAGATNFQPARDGFSYASELAAFVKERFGDTFCVGGACYPEGHPECRELERGLQHLAIKERAGAEFLITQLFFDNRAYFDFVARARAAGVRSPIVPGIMPITNVAQIERMTRMCGASMPARLAAEMDRRREDPAAVMQLGVAFATAQCMELLARGAPGIHFYTLNQSPATRLILTALVCAGVAPPLATSPSLAS